MEHSIPWTEKYRPQQIEDIIFDPYIEQQIKIFLEDRPDMHLIITGLPGIGKTSTVRCIAKKTLGDNLTQGYLELNAAEDRGVRSISMIIPSFCKRLVNFTTSKIILLDEADNMTAKCQNDINDMMKKYGKKTKFIFTCNDSSKIVEDIQSVCRILRFKKLTDQQISKYLEKICNAENIEYNNAGLSTICYISNGDMRKSINNLQLTAFATRKINKKNVLRVCKVPDPEQIKKILDLCFKQKLIEANTELNTLTADGYFYLDIVAGFIYILANYGIKENIKLKLMDIVNKTKITISTGLRSKVQLAAMLARLIREINQN